MSRILHCSFFFVFVMVTLVTAETSIFGKCVHTGTTFNCSAIELLTFPEEHHIPDGVETLDFSNNHINNITVLQYMAFTNSLSKLNLANNQISLMAKNAFKYLTSLVSLDLSRNHIEGSKLEELMFYDLRKLKYLNMEKNPLRCIKTDTFNFMELPALLKLDLSHCDVSEIEDEAIDLPSLEYLDLSWNWISNFRKGSFKMLTSLQVLDMSHNSLHVLEEVPYMPELRTWILDSNGMESITINEGVEDFADKLEKLSLKNNNILRFSENSLPLSLESLQVIDMSGNSLHCDCRMRWIAATENDFTSKNFSFQCEYPSSMKGKDLLKTAAEDLKCGLNLSKLLFIVMIAIVCVLIMATVIFFVIRRRRRRQRQKRAAKGDRGGDYTAVYTREEDDIRMSLSDNRQLLENEREFDV